MRIVFIGTSHGVPEAVRRCSCTMLEVSGRYYFIDMGTSAIDDITRRGISVNDVKSIFITHPHGDHTDGLIPFIDIIDWYYTTANPDVYFSDINQANALKNWLCSTTANKSGIRDGIGMHEVKEGTFYDDGFIKVTAIPTKHCPHSFAYMIEAEGKSVLFTGDLKHPSDDFPAIAFEKPFDLIVCESAHFSPEDTEAVLEKTTAKKVVINHVYRTHWAIPLSNVMSRTHKYDLILSNDGMELQI